MLKNETLAFGKERRKACGAVTDLFRAVVREIERRFPPDHVLLLEASGEGLVENAAADVLNGWLEAAVESSFADDEFFDNGIYDVEIAEHVAKISEVVTSDDFHARFEKRNGKSPDEYLAEFDGVEFIEAGAKPTPPPDFIDPDDEQAA